MSLQSLVFISATAAGLALVGATGAARAQSYEFTVGSSHPEGATANKLFQEFFIPEVQSRAKAEGMDVTFRQAWSGSLCKPGECLRFVQDGLLDIGDIQVAYETGRIPFASFSFYTPFGSPDPRLVQKAGEIVSTDPAFTGYLEDHFNQVYLANVVLGDYMLLTTFEWDSMADLAGHKIAAAPTLLPMMHGTGMVPVTGSYPEAYVALQTGVYEGWFLPADSIVAVRLQEVSKQAVSLGLGSVQNAIFTMNKDRWDGLPANLQTILSQVGAEYSVKQAELAFSRHEAAVKTLQDSGIRVFALSPEMQQQWAASLENLPAQLAATLAPDMPDTPYQYLAEVTRLGHVFPRDWLAEK